MESHLRANIRLYSWLKVFTKRVYLPLTTIYLVEAGHLSLGQIGALVTVAALASIAADIPTGYFADRVARKTSLAVGAFALALGAFIYMIAPSFIGAICAVTLESLGFSFISGAGEALMHDTLVAMKKVDQYVRVMGKAQSYGLVGNIVLVGLVPMTYPINKRLPFAIGVVSALVLAFFALRLTEPPREKAAHLKNMSVYSGLVKSLRTFINRYSIWIFISIGLLSAYYTVYAQFINLVYKNLGVNLGLIGLIYSASSIVGAIGGLYVHHLKRLPFIVYALFDVVMATGTMIAIGLTHNLWVAITLGMLNLGFWRLRNILYQDKLLRLFGGGGSKATLISALDFFDDINEIWLPILFVAATTTLGFYRGFATLGVEALIILSLFMVLGVWALERHKPAATPTAAAK